MAEIRSPRPRCHLMPVAVNPVDQGLAPGARFRCYHGAEVFDYESVYRGVRGQRVLVWELVSYDMHPSTGNGR